MVASVLSACSALLVLAAVLAPVQDAAGDESVPLFGHGYGHGRGLSQWGSYGYAVNFGSSYSAILNHYYGGTVSSAVGNPVIGVRLTAQDGANSVSVTAAVDFWVGQPGPNAIRVGAGHTATFSRSGAGWQIFLAPGGCGTASTLGPLAVSGNPEAAPTAHDNGDARRLLTVCSSGLGYRGNFRFVVDAGSTRMVNVVDAENYLRGVVPRESPAEWGDAGGGRGMEALKAQSVAARSYGLSENRYSYAQTCDTTSCQVYGGAARHGAFLEDRRTDDAVRATAGEARTRNGVIARTEFSSSSGGWTAGGEFPAVIDEGDTASPYHNWTHTLTGSQISRAYPSIGTYTALTVLSRNGLGAEGGRVLSIRVSGTSGSVTVSGNDFRTAFGLRSDWFTPTGPVPNERWWEVRNVVGPGPSQSIWYGDPHMQTLACDVNGDGRDDMTLYDNGRWSIRFSLSRGAPDLVVDYGGPGLRPVCGDWDGNGQDGIGVYDGYTWHLRQTASPGVPELVIGWGWPAVVPIVGDWNGDGVDSIGAFDPLYANWWLRNANSPGNPDVIWQYGYGNNQSQPVPGDYDGNRVTDLTVFISGQWYIRTAPGPGPVTQTFGYGLPTDFALSGNWDGLGGDGIGGTRPGVYPGP
ncbi:MAG: SpoIID/LytB domain-containing protein [Actinomycetota bacterium]|nr:SpoIID/LytB domain-containing protein [Actinomycetota bacterium]